MADTSEVLVLSCACGQKMKIPADGMGRTFKCVRCGAHIKVTEENSQPLPSQAPPPEEKPPTPEKPPAPEREPAEPPAAQKPIGDLLVGAGLITEEQLGEALSRQKSQGGKTFEILLALGYLDKDALHAFLSRQPGIANIDLSRFNISPELVNLIPKKLAVENLVLPIDQLGKLLTVAMACPLDVATIQLIEQTTGLRVKAMLCKLEDIHAAVQKYYPERKHFELSPSSFDHLPGASAPRDKVDEKLKKWNGMMVSGERLKQIAEEIAPPEVTLDLVTAVVLNEPGLGATLLRVANSEMYGFRGQVDSIPMAVAVIGKPGIQQFLTEFLEPADPKAIAIIAPWVEISLRAAQYARDLARESGVLGPHVAYSLGLVSELGRMAMALVSPLQYKRVKANLHGEPLAQSELKVFTMDHCEVAGMLGVQWHFPASITRPLEYYLAPAEAKEMAPQCHLLALAIGLANKADEDREKVLAAYSASIEALGISADAVRKIVGSAR